MSGWRRNEYVRGKASLKPCLVCGHKPCITEASNGFFTITCARCAWEKPYLSISVDSTNLYHAIKLWNQDRNGDYVK